MPKHDNDLTKKPSKGYVSQNQPRSLHEELVEATVKQQEDALNKLQSNVLNYSSSTDKFKEEMANLSRKLSVSSQASDSQLDLAINLPSTSQTSGSQDQNLATTIGSQPSTSNPSWQCNDYILVNSRKNKRSPEANARNVRPKAVGILPEPTAETQNRYSPLLSVNINEDEDNIFEEAPKKPQIQPIFVTNIINFKNFQKDINDEGYTNKYAVKVLSNQIKIIPEDIPTYKGIISFFKTKNVSYFTHRLKQERSFRVVLKNVHHSTPSEDIIEDLADLGYVAENVYNIKHAKTKEPLSMFFIDLKNDPNNKNIYSVTKMGNKIVSFEPPNKRREIPQCKRCQRFGHTQNNCGRSFRCVKCTGNHSTTSCPKPNRDTPATCTNCGEDHPANYKGCQVYRHLLEKKFPALRKREFNNLHPTSRPTTPNYVRDNFSYAKAAQSQKNHPIHNEDPSLNQPEDKNAIAFMKQSFEELKEMFRDVMKQNSVMVNLLTSLVSKLN